MVSHRKSFRGHIGSYLGTEPKIALSVGNIRGRGYVVRRPRFRAHGGASGRARPLSDFSVCNMATAGIGGLDKMEENGMRGVIKF